jgi:hypothetical protein
MPPVRLVQATSPKPEASSSAARAPWSGVGLGRAADPAADPGQDPQAVGVVQGPEPWVARAAELQDGELPLGLEDPEELAVRFGAVLDVADAIADGDAVEGAFSEGEMLGVRAHGGPDEVRAALGPELGGPQPQHGLGEIRGNHFGAPGCDGQGGIPRAGGHVQEPLAWPCAGKPRHAPPPIEVGPEGKNMIKQVIFAGNAGKHCLDLFSLGHGDLLPTIIHAEPTFRQPITAGSR